MADEDIEVRARLIADTGEFLTPMAQAQAAISQFHKAVGPTNKMLLAAGAAAGAAGFALFKYGKAAFHTAATVAELDVAIEAVGRSTGLGANRIREATEAIRSNGIEMEAAQRIALTYARNNLDLAAASKVARVAQDLAVLSQKDSTQTAELLTRAIQTGSSILLKSAGISRYASEGYAAYARQLGKNANSLTAVERQQATVNLVLEEGAKVAGVYERAMTEPGKVLRSFKRLQSDMRDEFGKVLLSGFGPSIKALYDLTNAFSKSLREGGPFADLLKKLGDSARIMGQPIADAIGKMTLFIKNIDEGVVPAGKLQKAFERLAPAFASVSAGLSAMTGAKLLSFFGPLKGIASKISPFVTAIVFLTALSPKLQESFAKLVAAAKPLVPAFIAIGAAVMEMAAVAADFFTVIVEVMAKLAPLITGVADAFSGLSKNLGILKPLLQFVAVAMLGNYIKGAFLARDATGAFTNKIMQVAVALKNSFGAAIQATMRLWSNFQFGIKTGNGALASFKATAVAAFRTVGLAAKELMIQFAPMIAIFAAFKFYEMFTKSSKEAKERTKELSDAIKDQIYQLKGAATAISGYATDLRGINDNLMMTGENADKIRLAMADLNIPLGKTLDTFRNIKKDGADAIREIARSAGVSEDAMAFVVDYTNGLNRLKDVPEQYREQAVALKTLQNEAKKINLKDLVKTQIEQIRITSKLGEKAYKLAKEQAAADGVLKGALDTEEEYLAVNELLAQSLVKLEAKEKAKAKSTADAAKKTLSFTEANHALITSLNTLKQKTDDGKVSVDAFAETMFGGFKDANQFTAAISGMRESAYGLAESLKNTKGNTDEFNKAGMALFNQLTENGAKITELGGNTGDLVNYYKSMIAQFTEAAEAAGWNKEQIDELLKSLGILQALDSITVKIDADIRNLKMQLLFATQNLEKFEKLSGFYNQQRAENYARLISSLNSQIATLEKSTTAVKTNAKTWTQWTGKSDAASKAADKLEKQKEKLRRKIMEVAEKALAKARERMEEYKQAMDAMADAAKTAIYGSYSLTDAGGGSGTQRRHQASQTGDGRLRQERRRLPEGNGVVQQCDVWLQLGRRPNQVRQREGCRSASQSQRGRGALRRTAEEG
ncbi:MAG: hypothetical protein EBT75_00060 [Proteobacteria bacterium]|nr:hypothetical protein [Pseudomonadota bacterium]